LKKILTITFILGAVTGSLLTTYLSDAGEDKISAVGKTLSKTESKTPSTEIVNGEVLDIPDDLPLADEGLPDMDAAETADETADDANEAIPTQMERFERSIAAEAEAETVSEDLPTTVLEEAPPENPPEIPAEETIEDEPK
jgi:hypothetical protein